MDARIIPVSKELIALHHSFVLVHTECGQWQASFIREKLVGLVEVSATKQILQKFPNPGGTEQVQTVCTRLFSLLTHESKETN